MPRRSNSLFRAHGNGYRDHATITQINDTRKIEHNEDGSFEAIILGERKRYNPNTYQWEKIK